MKKVLLAIAAVATITSCSQNEEFENLGQKAEIKMGTTAVTRATVMTTSKFLNFKAFGYYFTEGSYTAEVKGTKILDGIFNSVDQTTWTEKSGEKFYWPSDGKVTFFGYSPSELPESNSYSYSEAGGYPTVSYTVNNTIADQVDFLVAQLANQTKDSNAGKVSLSFKHALTQIVFKLKGDDKNVTYKVTNIAFNNLKATGSYDYKTNSWTPSSTPAFSYSITLTENNSFVGGDDAAKTLEDANQLMILMPQELSDVTVDVTFSAEKNGVEIFPSGVKTATLSGTWFAGDKYVYTLVLKAGDEIVVSGEFEDNWTPKTGDANVENDKK